MLLVGMALLIVIAQMVGVVYLARRLGKLEYKIDATYARLDDYLWHHDEKNREENAELAKKMFGDGKLLKRLTQHRREEDGD